MDLTVRKAVAKAEDTITPMDSLMIHFLRSTIHEKEKITKM